MATDPSFDPRVHDIVEFKELIAENEETMQKLKNAFKTRGWCIIRLPNAPVPKKQYPPDWLSPRSDSVPFTFPINLGGAISSLAQFFEQPEKTKVKSLGYASVPHKESIHITTPCEPVPGKKETLPNVQQLCDLWDEVSVALIESIAKNVFGVGHATVAHRADLPIAWGRHRGMLDIAHYLNKQTATLSPEVGFSTQDVNCVPHFDPGLLTISFLSTLEGLQLKDPQTGAWFAGPVNTVAGQEDLGVIWLGEAAVAASNREFQAGVHRVVYPQSPVPRITVWYEVCTLDQVNAEIMGSKIPADGTLKLHNLPGSKPLKMTGDLNLIERHYGIPMSKSGRPFKNQYFRAMYSEDADTKKHRMGSAEKWDGTTKSAAQKNKKTKIWG